MINLKIDIRGFDAVQKKLAGLTSEMQGKVLRPAINKTADKAKAEINRAIPQEYAVKASEVRSAIDIRKASGSRLQADITIFGSAKRRGRSLNLIHFLSVVQALGKATKVRGGKGNKKEVAALEGQLGFLIKKGCGLKKIQGAFVGNKGRTVFIREGKARLPIKPLQVIGFSQMFNSKRIRTRVIDKINKELPIEVDRAIQLLMSKL